MPLNNFCSEKQVLKRTKRSSVQFESDNEKEEEEEQSVSR
jgi:hypothetical protein